MKQGSLAFWTELGRLLVFVSLGIAGVTAAPAHAATDTVRLVEAQAVLKPDSGEISATDFTLPLRWDKAYPGTGGYAQLTMTIPARFLGTPFGLYFKQLGNQAVVRINETVVLELGQLSDARTNHSKAPVLVEVPRATTNLNEPAILVVEMTTQAGRWGGMAAPVLGEMAQLTPRFQRHILWTQTASTVTLFSLIAMGLLAFWLYLRQRDQIFGFFVVLAASGTAKVVDRLLTVDPLPWPYWGAFSASGYVIHILCIVTFALLVAGVTINRLGVVLSVATVFVSVVSTASFVFHVPGLWTLLLIALLGGGVFALIAILRMVIKTGSKDSWIILVSASLVAVVGARDLLLVRLPEDGIETFAYMPIALFLQVIVMAWIIVDRFSQSVANEKELSKTLAKRVEQKEAELKESYLQLAEQGRQQATFEERQRIMRDIHDGVGAHLVSLLNLTQRQDGVDARIAKESQMALDELRMAIDSLTPVEDDLELVLATLRYRMLPRLEENGLSISWDVETLPSLPNLTPSAILNIQRILLESFTNIIRHSSASHVIVKAIPEESGGIVISVTDNGVGINALSSAGKGLANMQARAQAIGATLSIDSAIPQGTAVSLKLPASGN